MASGSYAAVALAQQLDAAIARAAFLAVTITVTATLVRLLRDHVFALIEALNRAARTDALTGVMNRMGLDDRLDDEIERSARTRVDCAVLIADLDHFKALNDRLGHQAGDEALKRVATTITGRIRRLDAVGRFGGDEFVVILPGTAREDAARLAEELEADRRGQPVLQVSFGIAVSPDDGASVDEIIHAADTDLLASKRSRRRLAACASNAVDHHSMPSVAEESLPREAVSPG